VFFSLLMFNVLVHHEDLLVGVATALGLRMFGWTVATLPWLEEVVRDLAL